MLFRFLREYVSRGSQAPARRGARARLAVEALEGRALLSTFVVDRLTDLGEGTDFAGDLRYCIEQAQDKDTIQFAVKGTINLTRALPDLTRSISIEGPGAELLTVRRDTGGDYRILTVAEGVPVSLFGLTITRGFTWFDGGGIHNRGSLILSNSVVTGNESCLGGGIRNVGMLEIQDSVIRGNAAVCDPLSEGGGIDNSGTLILTRSNVSGNRIFSEGACYGAGIFNTGTLTINNSVIAQNRISQTLGGGGVESYGGGIANWGTATISNSTVSGNGVFISGYTRYSVAGGGGVLNGGNLLLTNSTVAENELLCPECDAVYYGGIGGGNLRVRNTIVAGNYANSQASDTGRISSLGHNLIGNSRGGTGYDKTDLLDVDPLLGPLQDNGGSTQTMALLPGSLALDAGDNTDAPEFDQRGLPRIVADTLDIGAFEVQPGLATWFRLDAPDTVASGAPFDVTLSALDDYGHLATGYAGTVTFFTTDKAPGVLLPADYTFTADDQGRHIFAGGSVLVTPGEQSLSVRDTDGKLSGEAVLTVTPGTTPSPGSGRSPKSLDGFLVAVLVRAPSRLLDRLFDDLAASDGPEG